MSNQFNKTSKYTNILNRIQKKFSTYETIFLIKKLYFTNNIVYYFLCILTRFLNLISFLGDFSISNFDKNSNSIRKYIKGLTCYSFVQKLNFSFAKYITINIVIFIFFIIRVINYLNYIKKVRNYKNSFRWPIPNDFFIIIDHIVFLFFPYIIEYLSFSYYIYFFPSNFIIKLNNQKILSLFAIIINTILIVIYNLENYIDIICSNKIYTISFSDAYSNICEKRKIRKSFAFRCSNLSLYIYIFVQNFALFLTIEKYINRRYQVMLKIIISTLLLLTILFLFINKIHEYNLKNFINSLINTLALFCFYSIIIDFIVFILEYRMNNKLTEIIYIITKLFLSFITYLLFRIKVNIFLESKITEILFQEKNNKDEKKYFINSFYYLHQIMIKIKEENKIESTLLLVKFLNKHINKCDKIACNCKLLKTFIINEDNGKINNDDIIYFHSQFLIILNYLFESAFIDYDFYNNFDLAILLAEHQCHLKGNPMMAFSTIYTFIQKQNNRFSKFQIVILYELCQKYIYYLSARIIKEIEVENKNNNIQFLKSKQRADEFRSYFYNLRMSYKVKRLISNYIYNELKILKYKIIFEDSLSFQIDEYNENISIKINFFNQSSSIDDLYVDSSSNKKRGKIKSSKENSHNNNLYIIIYLLKKEQYFYRKIITYIKQLDVSKGVLVFMIYKYFLFFDIFEGGKMPDEIKNQLYEPLVESKNSYSGIITNNEYKILKQRYNEQNNRINSKFYVIVELRRGFTTKYLTEDASLKLGFKQKDLINETMNILLPSEFRLSHQNSIRHLIIGNQIKYRQSKQTYYFNKNNTVLYSANIEATLLYNLAKSFVIILESFFNFENEYRFMFNNNFELLACSKNFEEEYYLNQKIIQVYKLKLMNVLKIKPEKIYEIFKKDFEKIHHQKEIRQYKTEEYFISQLYSTSEDKNFGLYNPSYFNTAKKNIISKISSNYNEEEILNKNINDNNEYSGDEEEAKFIIKQNFNNSINDLLDKLGEIIFHSTYNKTLNKGTFIENLAKELIKIPDNDLMMENDKINYDLITSSKQLINNLLSKSELSNQLMRITTKLSFYYDKPFYFITIEDPKKIYLNISKKIKFENSNKSIPLLSSNTNRSKIPFNKNDKKSRNKTLNKKKDSNSKNNINKNSDNLIDNNENNEDFKTTINKIKDVRKQINKDKFISIIKLVLSIIITCILIIFILIVKFQTNLLKISHKILNAYFYNYNVRDMILNIHSELLQIYYEYSDLLDNSLMKESEYQAQLLTIISLLKDDFHEFSNYFNSYNLETGHNLNILYKKRKFIKVRGFWQEFEYESIYSSELDFIIYNIFSINVTNRISPGTQTDFKNFLFFKDRKDERIKPNTAYIRLLYYLCVNYEFVYKDIFIEIANEIFDVFKNDIFNKGTFIIIESSGFIFYFLFYIIISFYLYYSNEIIIKNIIFLFLDFSEKYYEKSKSNNNAISLKLQEFQNVIDDFNLGNLEKYSKFLDHLNKNKSELFKSNKDIKNIFNFRVKNNENKNESEENKEKEIPSSRKSIKKKPDKNSLNILKKKTKKIIDENSPQIDGGRPKNKELDNSYIQAVKSFSIFFKQKLIKNVDASNELLKNSVNNSNNFSNHNLMSSKNSISEKTTNRTNSLKNGEKEDLENFQDILINKSIKSTILIIKIFAIVIFILIFALILFNIYKLRLILDFNSSYYNYFTEFEALTVRFSMLFYYTNNFRTLLLFPMDKRKNQLENIMEHINEDFENINNKYINILSRNTNKYNEIKNLIEILKTGNNVSIDKIRNYFCQYIPECIKYLNSEYNIFQSGIEFALKTCVTQLSNYYMDYTKLSNKTDINLIKSQIINSPHYKFVYIENSINCMFNFVREKIFSAFQTDEINFNQSSSVKINLLNIISITATIIIFLFVNFYVFISISNFTEPIKDSTFRVNCSFYYIKKFSIEKDK